MSKIADKLRSVKIFNEYGITEHGHPLISFRPADNWHSSTWLVSIKGFLFKNERNGSKEFTYYGGVEKRKQALTDALEFIKKRFPDMEMVKSPFGWGYVPKDDLANAMKKAKENKDNVSDCN